MDTPCRSKAGGGDKRLRRAGFLARHHRLLDHALFDRPHRFPRRAIEHVDPTLLGGLRHGLDVAAIDGDVHQDRSAGDILVPDAVVYQLEEPAEISRVQVDGHKALSE